MLTRRVRLQVIGFLLLGLAAVAYVAANYVGLDRLIGASGYTVTVQLSDSGGIFSNAEVDYRGVPVGRVGALRLTDKGVNVELHIDKSAESIPADVEAVVANRSAVGEQYVDLRPRTASGPLLGQGSVILQANTKIPLPVESLLSNLDKMVSSVPTDSLHTLIDEFDTATRGAAPDFQVLLDTTHKFTETANQHVSQATQLVTDATTVLRTQNEEAAALTSFGDNAKLVAKQLADSDTDLRKLIAATPELAAQVGQLVKDTNPSLGVLIANLLTTSTVAYTRQPALQQLLVSAPKAVAVGSSVITPDGAKFGLSLTFFDPPPCTAGYGGTTRRDGFDTGPVVPLNTGARCALGPGDATGVRGAQNAPR
ncbi:MCE family protein [Kutzneria albida]|uniref:Uncharacterized protein n=1 Tax=Kutzneria albida DSM 43870 TaxID=1449976 RepID=W5WFS5_9PSEU|nr:MlaD family protein [Kutzneria albida]AHH99667.1 hypothetical protein KALB_6307 [Kutzneria albida DSM 43870]